MIEHITTSKYRNSENERAVRKQLNESSLLEVQLR